MANLNSALFTEVLHPFARGTGASITASTGVQYGASVSTAGSTSFIDIESVNVLLPEKAVLAELSVGLTMGLSITVTTDAPSVKYLIQDYGGASFDTLYASTAIASTVSTTTLVDDTRFISNTPTSGTNFTGKGSFTLKGQAMSSATTSKVQGAMKASSYVQYSYYLIG